MKKIITLLMIAGSIIPVASSAQNNILNFDGTNDYVSTNIVESPTTFANWTIECWVKSPNGPNASNFTGPVYGNSMGIIWNHSNISFMGAATVESANGTFYSASFGNLLGNSWYHLAATYDGSSLKTYRNGNLVNTTATSGGIFGSTNMLSIGKHPTLSNFFSGDIDEVRIWTTARTASEINANMNTELTGVEAGLRAYYNFNQGIPNGNNTSITNLLDQTSNGFNGTFNNFTLNGNTSNLIRISPLDSAIHKNALHFDGVNDFINTNIITDNVNYANWTFECWVKGNAAPSTANYSGPMYADNCGIVWNHSTGNVASATVQGANGNFYFASFGTLTGATWYHLAATYDGTTLKSYTNGLLISSVAVTGGGLTSAINSLKIGKHPSNADYFNGTIDEARIWNTARTCSEINNNMNTELIGNEPNLKAYYSFNQGIPSSENLGITAIQDTSVNSNNASMSGFALVGSTSNFVNPAPFNALPVACDVEGLNFDGVNDDVTTPIIANNATFANWTLECWVKSPNVPNNSNYCGPIYHDNMAIIWNHISSGYRGAASVGSANGTFYAASFGNLNANTWYHLAATYDGTILRAYTNGVLITSVTTNGGMLNSTLPIKFARHPSIANFLNCTMDEVRIWNTARSCSDINSTMNLELAGNEPGLIANYDMNDGIPNSTNSNTFLVDKTINANNATLNNFALSGTTSNFAVGSSRNATVNPACPFSPVGLTTTKSNDNNFTVYPNPASDKLYIAIENGINVRAEIISIDGKLLQTLELNEAENNVDLTNLSAGFYTLRLTTNGQTSFAKFIKQ